jgi:hypothetical protein
MRAVSIAFGCQHVPGVRLQSEFLNEFYIMDVALNRAPSPAVLTCDGKGLTSGGGRSSGDICDVVRPVLSCSPEDVGPDEMDHFYRAAILFLPQCGVFYCHRDLHIGDAVVERIQHELAPLAAEGGGGGNGVQLSVVHLWQ